MQAVARQRVAPGHWGNNAPNPIHEFASGREIEDGHPTTVAGDERAAGCGGPGSRQETGHRVASSPVLAASTAAHTGSRILTRKRSALTGAPGGRTPGPRHGRRGGH